MGGPSGRLARRVKEPGRTVGAGFVCKMASLAVMLGAPAALGASTRAVVVLTPTSRASRPALNSDVPVLDARLRALGDAEDVASVRKGTIVVSGTGPLPVPASELVMAGHFYFRPVLCYAPPYAGSPATGVTSTPPPALPAGCASQYQLTAPT
jgi:hypothetical protein